jgi:ABC-type nitrate/sulfonate/bicarbonate transport system permease component
MVAVVVIGLIGFALDKGMATLQRLVAKRMGS